MRRLLKIILISLTFTPFFFSGVKLTDAQGCGLACGSGGVCTSPNTCVNGVCTSSTCPSCQVGANYGACTAPMGCPSGTQSEGTCTSTSDPYDICCVPTICPTQGTTDCGGSCSSNSNCLSGLLCDTASHQCHGTVCSTGLYCPLCTGTSGYPGVCMNSGPCDSAGKNSLDGSCTNPVGTVCCTNAPSGASCTLSGTPPYLYGADIRIYLESNTPNARYQITTSPGTCLLMSPQTVDANGENDFPIVCPSNGTYILRASTLSSPSATCSLTINVSSTTYQSPTPMPTGSINTQQLYGVIQSRNGLFRFSSDLTLGGIISPSLIVIFPIAGSLLLLMIIYGGYNFMFSAGDPKKAQTARDVITTALIGFIIIFTAFWIVNMIGRILGLSDITNIF